MNPNALQIASIPLHAMDNATLLSFMHMVDDHGQANATMREKMGEFFTGFHTAFAQYDLVFNPARRMLETEDLIPLDSARDNSLGAYHEAILGLQRHPVEAKRLAARKIKLNFDTYSPDRSMEYMKETEIIEQMTTEIRNTPDLLAAIELLGLDDYLADLEQKNQAFADLMRSRTAATEGNVKGAVAAARTELENKYQLFRQMINVAAIYEGDTDYRPFMLSVNAEVEHFKDILARKGYSSGGGSDENQNENENQGGGGSDDQGGGGSDENQNENENQGGGGSDDQGGGGSDDQGGGDTPTPTPDPTPGPNPDDDDDD